MQQHRGNLELLNDVDRRGGISPSDVRDLRPKRRCAGDRYTRDMVHINGMQAFVVGETRTTYIDL